MDTILLQIQSLIQGRKKTICFLVLFIAFVTIYLFLHRVPKDFPINQVVTIHPGESLQEVTNNLYDLHIIRSPFAFRTHVILLGGEKKVMAGDYLLDRREGPADLAYRFVGGKFHLKVAKITIPEGWNVFQIGDYLEKTLINFNKTRFIGLAKSKEGYLFPDTYFVSPAVKPEAVITMMNNVFEQRIATVTEISKSPHTLKDIIIIASILENEARTTESRRIISGILWKRLSLGMPLQVDSTFSYVNGKNTYELTLNDLQIDSPYNTYKYAGLPPGPISNPGLDSIRAAVTPVKTPYLYFLSSKSGKMYYAKTFEEHKRNKELYLNS
jgi:UPF0755 protein